MVRNMKGQVMIMTAVVLILVVIAIRNEIDAISVLESSEFQRGVVQTRAIDNLRDEYEQTARLAFVENHDDTYIDTRLSNFTGFVRQRKDVNVLYSITHHIHANDFNITVRNFLDEPLTNVMVYYNFTGTQSERSIGTLDIGAVGVAHTNIEGFPATQVITVQINVTYTRRSTGEDGSLSYITIVAPRLNTTAVGGEIILDADGSRTTDVFYSFMAYNKTAAGGGLNIPQPCQIIGGCDVLPGGG